MDSLEQDLETLVEEQMMQNAGSSCDPQAEAPSQPPPQKRLRGPELHRAQLSPHRKLALVGGESDGE